MENVGVYTPPAAKSDNVVASDAYSEMLGSDELDVTESAVNKLAEIVSQSDDEIEGVRIYVGGGGCGGMSYGMTFTDQISEYDQILPFDNLKIVVDVVAMNYLRGAQIDYIQEVGRERFVFNNVFAETGGSGACGSCGSAGGGCS